MEIKCTCQKGHHKVPVKKIEISEYAIEKVPDILSGYKNIYMVADENTYKAAGERVKMLLETAGILSQVCILPGGATATAETVGEVLISAGIRESEYHIERFSALPDYILAVGSGSVNDICRMVSYRLGLEYGICGTAPSMDGYASVVAPLIIQNRKIVYDCTIARHIIIDLNICARAPYPLLEAGVGDMIGKYVAILDWKLSRLMTGEYYCETVAENVLGAAGRCILAAKNLPSRCPEDIRSIVEGLIDSGLGIAYTGTSRPAAGTEHMIGQTWEIMDLENHRPNHLHGIEVGEATFTAMSMFRRLHTESPDNKIKALIERFLPFFENVCELQRTLHLPFAVTDKRIFTEGVLRGRTFRERYTLLQYLYDRGQLDDYAQSAYTETMDMQ